MKKSSGRKRPAAKKPGACPFFSHSLLPSLTVFGLSAESGHDRSSRSRKSLNPLSEAVEAREATLCESEGQAHTDRVVIAGGDDDSDQEGGDEEDPFAFTEVDPPHAGPAPAVPLDFKVPDHDHPERPFLPPRRLRPEPMSGSAPVDFFDRLIRPAFFDRMYLETRRHWEEPRDKLRHPIEREPAPDADELRTFIGLLFHISVKTGPTRHFWSEDSPLFDPMVANTMSRDRFMAIWIHLHFNDNHAEKRMVDGEPDKLHKIRPLLEEILSNCRRLHYPGKFIVFDESMIAYRGHNKMRQYVPGKPTPNGYKALIGADPVDGYVIEIKFYTGKKAVPEHDLGMKIVLALGDPYLDCGHCFMGDSYFSSVDLCNALDARGTDYIGSFDPRRRGFPKDKLIVKDLPQWGHQTHTADNKIFITGFNGPKRTHIISTGGSVLQTVNMKFPHGETHAVPEVVRTYWTNYGAVDFHDELRSYYPLKKKSKRYYTPLVLYLFDVARVNGYIDYLRDSPENIRAPSLLDFTMGLARGLIGGRCYRQRGRYYTISSMDLHERVPLGPKRKCCVRGCESKIPNGCRQCKKYLCPHHFAEHQAEQLRASSCI